MTRRKIVYATPLCSFNSEWIAPIVDQYLEFEPYDPDRTYDPGTLFYTNCLDYRHSARGSDARTQQSVDQLRDRGFRVIIDNLWEVDLTAVSGTHVVASDRFFWYNESLCYSSRGYDQYQPTRRAQYRALMPINRKRVHRDDFVWRINCENLLWSYVDHGLQLPWDGDMRDWNTQRHFDARWYDQCSCSVVVETLVRPGSSRTPVFITEKTMKPLAFQHPFVVYGNCGVLAELQSWGFSTFDNLWSETYDSIEHTESRRDAVVEIVNGLEIRDLDTLTQEKIQHNRNLFFDRSRVIQGIVREIVEPILNYAETDL